MPVWYGAQPIWWAPLERDARRHFGDALHHTYRRDSLTYEPSGLDVIGEPEPVDVRSRSYEDPTCSTYSQKPEDSPLVPRQARSPLEALALVRRDPLPLVSARPGRATVDEFQRASEPSTRHGSADEPRLAAATDRHRQRHEPRKPVPPGPIERGPSQVHRSDAPSPLRMTVILMSTIPLLCQLKSLVTTAG